MTSYTRPSRWIDVAQPRLGSRVVSASDEFFGAKERLIDPAEPVFIAGKYDENGKWMDGWETRRRRGPGHDHCIIRLGRRSSIAAFEVDTRHFTGNFPPAAALSLRDEGEEAWREVVPVTTLEGDSVRHFQLPTPLAAREVRLDILPDGGVARLRIRGRVLFDPGMAGEVIDLAAMEHGGRAVAANDSHFGLPENLIAPGRGADMGDGWETRRRRKPGHDWAILELAAAGSIEEVLIDTAHFRGNYPDRAGLRAALCEPGRPDQLVMLESQFWPYLLAPQKLGPHAEHRFAGELADIGPVSHVRLDIFPDGGVSRLRVFGRPQR